MLFFFFNDTATTEIYTLSLHDALPICPELARLARVLRRVGVGAHAERPQVVGPREDAQEVLGDLGVDERHVVGRDAARGRSEEHTSELQSRQYLVCRLLLEKKKTNIST